MSTTLARHLDGCLGCRACEGACPSRVDYGHLADGAKAARVALLPPPRRAWLRTWLGLLSDARASRWLARAAMLYRRLGLWRLAEATGVACLRWIRPLHRLTPAINRTARAVPPAAPPDLDLEIFVGCMGELAQGQAIAAARALLDRLGLRAVVPPAPRCCGALLRHNGLPVAGDRWRTACARLPGAPPLIGLSSACVAELREAGGSADTGELCDFLDRLPALDHLRPAPLDQRVLVHEPCSHRNLLGGNGAVYRLLQRIPRLNVGPLPDNETCCGAAGTYMIQQPGMAEALLRDKLAAIGDPPPQVIVTTNAGCALHLIAGIREAGLSIEICHPVELLERQVERSRPEAHTPRASPSRRTTA